MSRSDKPLRWIGAAQKEIRSFPETARNFAGRDLRRVQRGESPADWKPMESVGPGTREIRIRSWEGGTVQHRVFYVAAFPEAVYVLHAFEKKSEKTSPHNLQVAAARYRRMLQMRDSNRSFGGDDRE